MDRQAELQDKIDAAGAWEIDNKLEVAMDALRTPDGDMPINVLSGGEKRRVALCRLLLQQPDVLLLDEPTNHLDAESVLWLEQHLAQYAGTVIAVTHDRYFLDNVAGWILELDRGEGIPWKGNYSSWLDQKSKRLEQEEKVASKRRKTLERELEWVRQGAKGRQTKQKATYFAQNAKDNPMVVVNGQVFSFFSALLQYHGLKDKSPGNVAKTLKVNPYFVNDYIEASKRFPMRKVSAIVAALRAIDIKSKGVGANNLNDTELYKEMLLSIFT